MLGWIGYAADDVAQPSLRVDVVQASGLDERVHDSGAGGRLHPTRRHDAGSLGREVVVFYPFHPLFEKPAMVVADRMHGGARHLTLQTEQGNSFLVPEWMTQSDAAAVKVVEDPRISVAQLRALRAFLDSILASLAGNIVPGEGGANGDTMDPAARGSFEPSPPVSQLMETERRKALDLLQALLAEAINLTPETAIESRAEARDDEDIA